MGLGLSPEAWAAVLNHIPEDQRAGFTGRGRRYASARQWSGLTDGIIGLVNKGQPGKTDDWGALRAWAWGASRALDYLETDKSIDARRVGIEGLSRYGKAEPVTMPYEQRFAVRFIGSSGAGRFFVATSVNRLKTSPHPPNITGWPAVF